MSEIKEPDQSYLQIEDDRAIFCGNLDINTLGGAGFASQRTTGDERQWDLSRFDGIEITFDIRHTDDKTYTFILKDEVLPPDPTSGREQSSVSWEYEFSKSTQEISPDEDGLSTVIIPWNALKPTYRGRPKSDAEPLKIANIKRMSIMMRSFFGTQEGDFTLDLCTISGLENPGESLKRHLSTSSDGQSSGMSYEKSQSRSPDLSRPSRTGMLRRMFCWNIKL